MEYQHLGTLPVQIIDISTRQLRQETSSGFTRVTTEISFHGPDAVGRGEDVTYTAEAHEQVPEVLETLDLPMDTTVAEVSNRLADIDLFAGREPDQSIFRQYRRWGIESAVLDLALRQADTSLAAYLDRTPQPVEFVVSTRLEQPPTGSRVKDLLDRDPTLSFKLDPTSDWTPETIDTLAGTGAVEILDLKGQYEGTDVDQPPDPALYQMVLEGFPEALIEDPALTDTTRGMFDGHQSRVTWDYPIQDVQSIKDLPWRPDWINIKPSRFGSIQRLVETISYCEQAGIQMFFGGQFELGVGRRQLHALASIVAPDSPNDIAPSAFNEQQLPASLPTSPLSVPDQLTGFGWPSE